MFLLLPLGNGYITTAVLKEILRELDDTLSNDDLDAMIEGNVFYIIFLDGAIAQIMMKLFLEIDSDGSGTVDFDGMYGVLI